MNFKDLFSSHAVDYAQYRPHYPPEIFSYLASLCPEKHIAWDCATGNGQAAIHLADHFDKVIATDPSERQIKSAERRDNILYRVEQAEQASLDSGSVDLITVAQALHWFKWDEFYPEVNRILKPEGIIVAIAYALPNIHPEVDKVILHFHNETLREFWEQERQLVGDLYLNIPFPFERISVPAFPMTKALTMEQLIGYISTWSGVKNYMKMKGDDPIPQFADDVRRAWPTNVIQLTAVWQLILMVGRKKK